jgi:hypothetical protein
MADVAWHSTADWQWLLGGSIVLLVVALILRAVKAANNSTRDSDPDDAAMETGNLYTRRIGITPIVAAERIDTPR